MSTTTPPPELHLPGLPDVAVQLGGSSGADAADRAVRAGLSWRYRLQQGLMSYLPLLLMALLAAGTWWLVRNTPEAPARGEAGPMRQTPDYSMSGFSVTRFGPDGQVVLRIDGDQLHHFPDTDRLEIQGVRIHAIGPDGRVTDATARRAVATGDASEVQLQGGAQVISQLGGADRLEVRSEFLHAFVQFERLRTDRPVVVLRNGSTTHAGGLDYDHQQGRLVLNGPVRARFPPATGGARP